MKRFPKITLLVSALGVQLVLPIAMNETRIKSLIRQAVADDGFDDEESDGGNHGGGNNGGGNNGGGNNGGGNNGGGNKNQQQSETKFRIKVEPTFFAEASFSRLVENKSQDTRNGINAPILDDHSHGLRVTDRQAVNAVAGAVARGQFENANGVEAIAPFLGVAPVAGSTVQAQRHVRSKAELEGLPSPMVPRNADDLRVWGVGDNIVYKNSGGIAFCGGVAAGPLALARTYVAKGDFTTFVQKTGEKSAYVKVVNSKLDSFSSVSGNALLNAKSSEFKGADEGFSYHFSDLSNPEAKNAYEQLMRGNMIPTQNLIKSQSGFVTLDISDNSKLIGDAVSSWAGIPFGVLNASSARTHTLQTKESTDYRDSSRASAEIATSSRTQETNVLFNKTEQGRAFTGGAYLVTGADGSKREGRNGQVVIQYAKEVATAGDAKDALKALANFTGMNELRKASPQVKDSERMNYFGVKFVLDMPQRTLDALVAESANREQRTKELSAFVTEHFRDYVSAMNHPADKSRQSIDVHESLDLGASLDAIQAMTAATEGMRKAGNDRAAFAKAYGKFGKAMITNSLTFQAGLKLIGSNQVDVGFEVSGERVLHLQRKGSGPGSALAAMTLRVPVQSGESTMFNPNCAPSGDGVPRQLESVIDIGRRVIEKLP